LVVSFRRRLTLFFILIVVVPMVALAALVLEVAGSSRTGKADARLAAGLETALSLYRTELSESESAVLDAARDPELAAGIRDDARGRIDAAAEDLVRQGQLVALRVLAPNGNRLAAAGESDVVAAAELTLRRAGRREGSMVGSVVEAQAFARRVGELTGREVVIWDPQGDRLAGTASAGEIPPPPSGTAETVELGGEEVRAASAALGGPRGQDLTLTLIGSLDYGGFAATRPLVALGLAGFFVVALFFVAMLLRSLQGQVGGMLDAARRIGQGDFSRRLRVEGNDEMAGLAREFNQMSDRLSTQMGELRRQRSELDESVQRIGEAFASGLDRRALLEIVAETAVSACAAEHARIVRSPGDDPEAESGPSLSGPMLEAALAAEREALAEHRLAEAEVDGAYAVAQPLAAERGQGTGAMTIVRRDEPFGAGQRDVLRYLIAQAAVSIENVELHELVAEQAVTDELTRLPNNRAFRSWIANEAARSERFGHELSLLMLDIDDFKQVNDTFGHLQGDEVLRAVGNVLREESRGVDEPARYGGEEFAIGLPETGTAGAVEFAERVRERIARTEIQKLEGDGSITVTASVGAATGAAKIEPRTLIDAADQALYRAKRAGKNRTEGTDLGRDAGADGAGKGDRTAKIRSDG
jgi:diguanylate cyclase (GGDEF)-like protein